MQLVGIPWSPHARLFATSALKCFKRGCAKRWFGNPSDLVNHCSANTEFGRLPCAFLGNAYIIYAYGSVERLEHTAGMQMWSYIKRINSYTVPHHTTATHSSMFRSLVASTLLLLPLVFAKDDTTTLYCFARHNDTGLSQWHVSVPATVKVCETLSSGQKNADDNGGCRVKSYDVKWFKERCADNHMGKRDHSAGTTLWPSI